MITVDELEDNGSTPTQEEVQPIESCEAEETHQDFTKLTPSSEAAPDTNAGMYAVKALHVYIKVKLIEMGWLKKICRYFRLLWM